ncbi:MAG TPA: GNAT family N-acetyltransferase [Candidatus Limnocylindrales bacterium]|nr:GNAT family N-acetyltransferase [Candidatus Limnocylindrales bacterium]
MSEASVQVERFSDAQAFLDAAGPFLAEREAEHNLLFGIAATLIVDPERYLDQPYLAAVRRDDDVVASAVMTPPFNVVLSSTEDPDAIAALGHDLGRNRLLVPGVTAPVEIARRFAELWAERHGLAATHAMAERIYRLERVEPPAGVSGTVRIATREDRDLLIDWVRAFLIEAIEREGESEVEGLVDSAFRTGSRTFYLWEDDGRPVSLAAATGPTPNGIRIGPVYTPPDARRRGYGSAVTAAASQAQLDAGRRFVFLFTDLKNPTSNKIYQAIGYEPVIDIDQWTFQPADAS